MKYEIGIALIRGLWEDNKPAWVFYAGQIINQEIWATDAGHRWEVNFNQKEQ